MQRLKLSLMRFNARRRPYIPSSRRPAGSSGGKRRLVLVLIFLLVGLLLFYIWTDAKIKPIVQQLATARVHYLAGMTVNDAINEVLNEQGINYGDLILFEKDVEGRISAIKTNMAAVNRLKTDVCRQVLINIEEIETSELKIPLGSVLQNDLLAGRGPKINVRLVPVGAVTANFENVFSSAGINQTRHQIVMEISVDMGVLAWGGSVEMNVKSQMVIAETVIVGNVPEYYTNIADDEIFK